MRLRASSSQFPKSKRASAFCFPRRSRERPFQPFVSPQRCVPFQHSRSRGCSRSPWRQVRLKLVEIDGPKLEEIDGPKLLDPKQNNLAMPLEDGGELPRASLNPPSAIPFLPPDESKTRARLCKRMKDPKHAKRCVSIAIGWEKKKKNVRRGRASQPLPKKRTSRSHSCGEKQTQLQKKKKKTSHIRPTPSSARRAPSPEPAAAASSGAQARNPSPRTSSSSRPARPRGS